MIRVHFSKYRLLLIILLVVSHLNLTAQTGSSAGNSDEDSVLSVSGNGKFYQIFPLVHAKVVYTDSVLASGKTSRDSFLYKAKVFFSNHEDAKYDFQSEDQGNGVVTYEGKLKKGYFSEKSDVYFSIDLDCSDSGCQFNLYEIIFASSKPVNNGSAGSWNGNATGSWGGHVLFEGSNTNTIDKAMYLENIPFDQGEYSRKYCEKLDAKLTEIMQHLKAALR